MFLYQGLDIEKRKGIYELKSTLIDTLPDISDNGYCE